MDGDIFGAASRPGRDAAESVARAVHGDSFDPFTAARCIEILIAKAEGIASLPAMLQILRDVCAMPLLAAALSERTLERVGDAVRDVRGTELDLILRSVVQKSILRGEYDSGAIIKAFCLELLDRAVVSPRGGFLERADGGPSRRREALAILAPVAADAARKLEARPDIKRLGISRRHAVLTPDSDLLGASP